MLVRSGRAPDSATLGPCIYKQGNRHEMPIGGRRIGAVNSATKLVAVLALALLIGGLSYWILEGDGQSVAPQSSAPTPTAAAPSAPPAAIAAAPPTPTAPAPSAPPVEIAAAPPTPTGAAQSVPPAATAPAPRTPTGAAPSTPPANLPMEAEMSEANRRQIQEALRGSDYYKGPADGIFGPLTRAAIRSFQRRIGGDTTGYLTAEEAKRLVSR
jgi:hypothetical protein